MRYTIKSRKFGRDIDFVASLPNSKNSAYIKVSFTGNDSNYRQICDGGYLMGSTISAREHSFEYSCKKWWKQYLRRIRKEEV